MVKLRKFALISAIAAASCSDFSNRNPIQEPGIRPPQVDCTIPKVRGILTEGNPQSRLIFAGVPITVQRSSFYETAYSSNATTSFSLNNGLGWHGVGEGSSVTYIATDERPTDMRVSLRYRVNETQVLMQSEPDCDLRCNQTRSLAVVISPGENATITNPRNETYRVSLGEFSENERYCRGICVISPQAINEGPMQEFRIIKGDNQQDRWDIHFGIRRLNAPEYGVSERCVEFEMEKVCIRLQNFDQNRRAAQVIMRIESDCSLSVPQ